MSCVNALTTFNVHATAVLDMEFDDAAKHVERVNKSNEVGTFFPKYNITIIPLSIYEDRNDLGNHEIFKNHVLDCFKANEAYIKCPKLIFAIEFMYDFDNNLFQTILAEIAVDYDFQHTKEIILCSLND